MPGCSEIVSLTSLRQAPANSNPSGSQEPTEAPTDGRRGQALLIDHPA
jgi:hypothetical protein